MPYPKDHETPVNAEDKMSEETRKKVYGSSEEETAPEDKDRERHYSGPSDAGKPDSKGSDRRS